MGAHRAYYPSRALGAVPAGQAAVPWAGARAPAEHQRTPLPGGATPAPLAGDHDPLWRAWLATPWGCTVTNPGALRAVTPPSQGPPPRHSTHAARRRLGAADTHSTPAGQRPQEAEPRRRDRPDGGVSRALPAPALDGGSTAPCILGILAGHGHPHPLTALPALSMSLLAGD